MKKVRGQIKRMISIVLAVAMVVTCVPQAGISALAAMEEPAAGGIVMTTGTEEPTDLTVPSGMSEDDTNGDSEETGEHEGAGQEASQEDGAMEDDGPADGEESAESTSAEDRTLAEDGETISGNEPGAEETVTTYTVTLPESAVVSVEITGGVWKDGDLYKADGKSDLTFTAAAAEGSEIVAVKYTVGGNEAVTVEAQDGVYTIPADAVTGDIVIAVETKSVEEGGGETPEEKVTVTFEGNTDKVSIYTVEKLDNEGQTEYVKSEQPVADNSLTVYKDKELILSVEAADKYKVSRVNVENAGLTRGKVKINGEYVQVYKFTPASDVKVTVTAVLDTTKANLALFRVPEGELNEYYTITANGIEGDDTNVRSRVVYTAKDSIQFTLTPDAGYKIDQITRDGETVETAAGEGGAVSFEAVFEPDPNGKQSRIYYTVAVSAVELEADGSKVTFVLTDKAKEGLALDISSDDKIVKVPDKENEYELKSGAQYVSFTLTRDNDKIAPVVEVGNDTGSRAWSHTKEGNCYSYKVSASLFAQGDKSIMIDAVPDKRYLTVNAYGGAADAVDMSMTTADGTEIDYYESGSGVIDEDSGEGYYSYVLYEADVDSELILVVTPSGTEGFVNSYRINDGEIQTVENNRAEIQLTLESDTTIEINPVVRKTITVKANPDEVDVLLAEDIPFGEFEGGVATRSEQQGTELTLYVKAKANSVIESYQINDGEEVIPEDSKSVTIPVTLADDITVGINSSYGLTQKLIEWRDETDTEIQAEDNVYAVDYADEVTAYTAMVSDKAGEMVVLSAAEITEAGTDAAPASTVEVATMKGSKFAQIEIREADAGKLLQVKLYENRDGVQNVVAVYNLQVRSKSDEVYASKVTLRAGAKTVTTGQDIKIADVTFDDKATCKEIAEIYDEKTGSYWSADNEYPENGVRVYAKDGAVYMSVDPNVNEEGWNTDILGKHTIWVAAAAEEGMDQAAASVTVTVVQGIHDLWLTAPTYQIYKADNKPVTLKTALVYNAGVQAAAPKAKTVAYSLVKAEWKENGEFTDSPYEKNGLSVDARGVIKIAKEYTPDGTEFCVKVEAKDFTGNTAAGYTDPLKVEGSREVLTAVYIVEETDVNGETEYRVVAKTGSGENLTSGDLDGRRVIAVTEKDEEDDQDKYEVGDIVKKYRISNLYAPSYLTYKSNNKALSIDKDGIITVNKANPKNNITITVTTNDGGKSSAKLEKLAIQYAAPMLGLRVERMDDRASVDDTDWYRWIDQRDFVESQNKNDTDNIEYIAASDSVLKLTVVGKYQEEEQLSDLGECANFTLAVSGAKVLRKEVSPYGQVVTTIIPTKKDVVVTLTDKANQKTARYKLTNNGFYTEAAKTLKSADIKTTDKLWANREMYQEIRYTVALPTELENFADNYVKAENGKKHQQDELYVMVKTDAADRSNAKKMTAYRSIEEGGNVNNCIPVEDIKISTINNKKVVTGTFKLDFWSAVTAGSYKLQMTFGTNSNENDETYNEIEPLTKAVAVNLKAAAAKKGSYKPFTAAKMSVKDKTYVEVAGTGKNFAYEEYFDLRNVNYNDGRYNVRFTDYFETFYDEESGNIVGLGLKPGLSDSTLKWLTGNTPDAKAARCAYMEYAAYNEDGSVLKSGTVEFSISFTGVADIDKLDKLKSVNAYAAPGVKVMEGTQTATIKVTVAKKPAELAYVYAEDTTVGIGEGENLYCEDLEGDSITLRADKPLQKKHNITLYMVPNGSYYQREIEELDNGSDFSWDEKVVPAIKAKGIKVTTTVTVVKKSTGKKIAVAKKDLAQRFAKSSEDGMRGYWGPDQNYWIDVPFTYNVEGVDIAEIETDKDVAENKSNNGIIGFGLNEEKQCISISLSKNDIAKVKNTKTNNKTKEKSVKVKATVSFCIPAYDSETGEIIKEADSAIKTEDITFNLTLPEEPKAGLSTYTEALANVQANKSEIEKIAPRFWNGMEMDLSDEWQGTYYLHEEFKVTGDEGNEEWRRNDLFDAVSETIWAVEEKLREYAPEDSDTVIEMTQYCHWEGEGEGSDWIELATDDFTAPTYKKDGRLVIRARLNNADRSSYNEENGSFKEYTEIAFNLTIPAAKEQPGDVESILKEFVRKAQEGSLVFDLSTNNTDQDMIEREARAYAKLRTYRTLRLDIWDFEKEPSTEDTLGSISGTLHVYGNRYGGEEVMVPFELIIPKRNMAVENHKAALDDIIWTCMDRIGEINGIADRNYDSNCNTFTVTIDTSYDNKSVKAEMDAWREQNKDNLDLYKNTLAGKLEATFGEDWKNVSSVSVIAEGSVRVTDPITGEDREVSRAISNAKVIKKQEGETIQSFADRLYDQLLANEDEYLEKCNEYLQKYDKDMTVDKIPFSFLHRATGNIRLAIDYTDGAKVSQTYKLNVK